MKFRVKIYTEFNQIVSDEIWYGASFDSVKYWVEKAVEELEDRYKEVYYEIIELREK